MTKATREALERVSDLLHEAGWDAEPQPTPAGTPEQRLEAIRSAFASLLDDRELALLLPTLGKGVAVADAGQSLGLSASESDQLVRDALGRLCAFTDEVEQQGYATAG